MHRHYADANSPCVDSQTRSRSVCSPRHFDRRRRALRIRLLRLRLCATDHAKDIAANCPWHRTSDRLPVALHWRSNYLEWDKQPDAHVDAASLAQASWLSRASNKKSPATVSISRKLFKIIEICIL